MDRRRREALKAEVRRTGMTSIALLRGDPECPRGLTAGSVNRWMNGLIRAVPEIHYEYVTAKWKALPDYAIKASSISKPNARPGRRHGDNRIPVTEDMASHVRAEFVRTGLDAVTVIADCDKVPARLTERIVRGWLYRHAATTEAAHWQYVTARLAAAPNRNDKTSIV